MLAVDGKSVFSSNSILGGIQLQKFWFFFFKSPRNVCKPGRLWFLDCKPKHVGWNLKYYDSTLLLWLSPVSIHLYRSYLQAGLTLLWCIVSKSSIPMRENGGTSSERHPYEQTQSTKANGCIRHLFETGYTFCAVMKQYSSWKYFRHQMNDVGFWFFFSAKNLIFHGGKKKGWLYEPNYCKLSVLRWMIQCFQTWLGFDAAQHETLERGLHHPGAGTTSEIRVL